MLNMTMASYAVFLATGHTIRSQSIKAATILLYFYVAQGFIKKCEPVDRDTRKEDKAQAYHLLLKQSLNQ